MRDRIADLLDKADLALASCRGVIEETDLAVIAPIIRNVRIRVSYPEDVIVAALAGGTGSGKSSLFNAIAGSEVTEVGGVRPTTSRAVAVASEGRMADLDGYLDVIGVESRVTGPVPDWLCLIDLPDTDSVETDHRLLVESLLPRLDVVIWVVDPEKYRDAALHHGHLRGLAAYAAQFVFVLNRSDRLDAGSLQAVLSDLETALQEDGIDQPALLATAAIPTAGPPRGVTDLVETLSATARSGGGVEKLMIDLEQAAASLIAMTGGAGGTGFEDRAEAVSDSVEMRDLLDALAEETGGTIGARIRKIAVTMPARSEEGSVVQEVREILLERAFANARLVELSLAVAEVRAAYPG